MTGVGAGETLVGIDVRPATGALYAVSVNASGLGRLYTLSTRHRRSDVGRDPRRGPGRPDDTRTPSLSGTASASTSTPSLTGFG